jgi:hypothetical protein
VFPRKKNHEKLVCTTSAANLFVAEAAALAQFAKPEGAIKYRVRPFLITSALVGILTNTIAYLLITMSAYRMVKADCVKGLPYARKGQERPEKARKGQERALLPLICQTRKSAS